MTTTVSNRVSEVANQLADYCRKGDFEKAMQEFYAPEILSVEACEMPGMPRETKGLQAVLKKGQQWIAAHEIHRVEVNGPLVSETEFALQFTMDVTDKQSGQRFTMKEIAVYQVSDGKIVRRTVFLFR